MWKNSFISFESFFLRRCERERSRNRRQNVRKNLCLNRPSMGRNEAWKQFRVKMKCSTWNMKRWEAAILRMNRWVFNSPRKDNKASVCEMSRFRQFSPFNLDFSPSLKQWRRRKRNVGLSCQKNWDKKRKGEKDLFSDFLLFLQRMENV